jgi:beta-phosphoglucomutase
MIRAIVFDLDGTLADTESLHFEAFRTTLAPHEIQLDRDEYFGRLIGFSDQDLFTTLLAERARTPDDALVARLMAAKAALYQASIADHDVLYPGAAEFVRRCAERFPLIIVTGTLKTEAELILRHGQIREFFLDIIAAEDVAHGKPEPDGFLAALGRLGFLLRPRPSIVAAECLAIEDTAAGVAAARRAAMKVLAVGQTAPAVELVGAHLFRPSLRETDLDELLRDEILRSAASS